MNGRSIRVIFLATWVQRMNTQFLSKPYWAEFVREGKDAFIKRMKDARRKKVSPDLSDLTEDERKSELDATQKYHAAGAGRSELMKTLDEP